MLHRQGFVLAAGVPLPRNCDIVACGHCGAVYADSPATQADYDRYYARHSRYEDPSVATGGGDSPEDSRRLSDTADRLASLVGPDREPIRVLDAGCARGGLLHALRRRGFRSLAGLDASPGCVARVRGDGFECFESRLLDLPGHAGQAVYDLIVLSHVLEHLVEVGAAIDVLADRLAPGGVLYVEVPDASRYAGTRFPPYYYFDPEHINHFDAASLANLAALHGLVVRASGQHDILLAEGQAYPVVWVALARAPDGRPRRPRPDASLRACVERYVGDCVARTDSSELESLAASRVGVMVWGAGSHAQRLLQSSPLGRCRIVAIVDRDMGKQGTVFFDHRVERPESAAIRLSRDDVVVIASAVHVDAIARDFAALGLENRVIVAR